ncbi:MAG TPA: hypothetical protein VIZ58_07845, partial [Thermoanaerobaculia bacterium]
LERKEAIRILHDRERRGLVAGERDFKRVLGGLLVQDRDWDIDDREGMEVACGDPDEATWGDLVFAWRVCKHVGSNAIVLAKNLATIEEAYDRALAADPVSAFGMVCALNRPASRELGERLAERFVDVLYAPGYEPGALEALRRKAATRILLDEERRKPLPGEKDYKRVLGGLLVQDRDWDVEDREGMEVVCGAPSESVWGDLLFAWRVCKHVNSNAIVIAKDLQTIGIGGGQTSRVDAVRLALEKAREHGHELKGAVLASDAFFPFPDGPQAAVDAGVSAIIQPGGSIRDADVTAAVEAAGATMVLTGRRHFRH